MGYRLAVKDDVKALFALQLRAFETEAAMIGSCHVPALMETFEENAKDFPNWTVLLQENADGKILGAIRFRKTGDFVEMGRLMVDTDTRHQGIASSLMRKAEEYSGGHVFELYTCSKSYTNIRLYKELGYKIYKEEKGPQELSFVYMRKTIAHKP